MCALSASIPLFILKRDNNFLKYDTLGNVKRFPLRREYVDVEDAYICNAWSNVSHEYLFWREKHNFICSTKNISLFIKPFSSSSSSEAQTEQHSWTVSINDSILLRIFVDYQLKKKNAIIKYRIVTSYSGSKQNPVQKSIAVCYQALVL